MTNKTCALCGQESVHNISQPFACWKCVLYFLAKPERALVLYDMVETPIKKRMLRLMMPEEHEEDLNERKSIRVGRSVVRKGPHRALKPSRR